MNACAAGVSWEEWLWEKTPRAMAGGSSFALLFAASFAAAQAPQTVRLRGVIEKIDGKTVMAKSDKGEQLKLNLADKTLVVEVVKASMADIKVGSFIGSGAMPQSDGSQKAIEVHIFADSMRGTGKVSGRGTALPIAL